MKISQIEIQNYRSVKYDKILSTQFNIFVGQNNHGKTNIFEAIDWFFTGLKRGESIEDIRFGRAGSDEVFVKLKFVGAQGGISLMKHEANRTKVSKLLGDLDEVEIIRTSRDLKKRLFIIDGKEIDPGTGFDNAFNDFLPKFEYIDTKALYDEVAKYGKTTPVGTMLSGVLEALLETDDNYIKFKEKFDELFGSDSSKIKAELDALSGKVKIYLEKQFPECIKVEFTVRQPSFEELLKNFDTSIDDGFLTDASEKGDGMQRALMLAIIQTYADYRKEKEDIGKSFLFFIDEAELHLHPTAQRNLKTALYELSQKGDQVFINTHSSVFVVDDIESQSIFKVEKIKSETTAKFVEADGKQTVVYELLGGSPTDLLLPANIVIVEGHSELRFISNIIKRHYPGEYSKIQIVPANGDPSKQDKSIKFLELAYEFFKSKSNPYSDKVVVIVDGPNSFNQTEYQKFKTDHSELVSDSRYFELPKKSLEEYYPSPYAKDPSSVAGVPNGKNLYAEEVSSKLSKTDFEVNMEIFHQALEKAKEKSFGN